MHAWWVKNMGGSRPIFVEVSVAKRFGKVSFAERQSRMSIDQTNRYCSNLRDSCLGVLKAAKGRSRTSLSTATLRPFHVEYFNHFWGWWF